MPRILPDAICDTSGINLSCKTVNDRFDGAGLIGLDFELQFHRQCSLVVILRLFCNRGVYSGFILQAPIAEFCANPYCGCARSAAGWSTNWPLRQRHEDSVCGPRSTRPAAKAGWSHPVKAISFVRDPRPGYSLIKRSFVETTIYQQEASYHG